MYLLLVLDSQYRHLLEIYGYFTSYLLTQQATTQFSNPTIIIKLNGKEDPKVNVVYVNENDYFDVIDIVNVDADISNYGDCKSVVKEVIPVGLKNESLINSQE